MRKKKVLVYSKAKGVREERRNPPTLVKSSDTTPEPPAKRNIPENRIPPQEALVALMAGERLMHGFLETLNPAERYLIEHDDEEADFNPEFQIYAAEKELMI